MSTSPFRPHRPRTPMPALWVIVLAGATLAARPLPARAELAPVPTAVTVERVRPQREKHATLRFLKANRDFIRGRYDLLRESPSDRTAAAAPIDPRFLAYRQMLADAMIARDSVAAAEDARQRRELFASVTELGQLEAQLDEMERLLGQQRSRLAVLQADFTGRQQTSLAIVVSGYPGTASVSTIAVTLEDGATLSIPISADQRASLQHGGILEIFHGLIEPRQQVVQVGLTGDAWPAADAGYVTLDPARDQLTFLRLDLTPVNPALGTPSIAASTWLHDARLPSNSSTESEP